MTETSPLGVTNAPKAKHAGLSADERYAIQAKQGRPLFGVQMRIVDDAGADLPHDGRAFGDLLVRGPWICREYYRSDAQALTADGWFRTGDVATIDADGFMQITDRSKDVIKTGGEWISSIALENIALSHGSLAAAAVIAVPHPKWDERPLLVAVRKPGATVEREALLAHFQGKVAKWWVPDDVVFVDALPYTATGKIEKKRLREQFRDHTPDA
jgi:fatty-acyl-CoA synthase